MEIMCAYDETRDLATLVPNPKNPNRHPPEQIKLLAKIMAHQGWRAPIVVSTRSGFITKGHGRLAAAQFNKWTEAPIDLQDYANEADEYADMVADNKIAELANSDMSMILKDVLDLGPDFDFDLLGIPDFKLPEDFNQPIISMQDKFIVPPFSVLDARQGYWQDRKAQWLDIGMQSELGRTEAPLKSTTVASGWIKRGPDAGGSIFDPVLCELAYRWFCPPNGTIIDPFAGGSVRGIVAAKLGKAYFGTELRGEQVDANNAQAKHICKRDIQPTWQCADALNIQEVFKGIEADLLFTCPPYLDLEVYSYDKRDLSSMKHEDFYNFYGQIIEKSCKLLKQDSFACIVVGEVRDKKTGNYVGFVPKTIELFERAGLKLYNEAILVTAIGSLPLRAGRQFSASRKLGKTHQNVLVFLKGDAKAAVAKLGTIEVEELEGTVGATE